MELKQLYLFKCVAEYEHMSRAAEHLGVPQPFLSKTISILEKELGVTLFIRTGRNIKLSTEGKYFYKQVTETLSRLNQTCMEVKKTAAKANGPSISIASNVGLYIPRFLAHLQKNFPSVRIEHTTAPREQLDKLLMKEIVDFTVCSPCPEGARGFEVEKLLTRDECVVIFPPKHWLSREAQNGKIRLEQLKDEMFIAVKKGYAIRDTMDLFFEAAGIVPHYAIETSDIHTVWELVKCGMGISFASFTTLANDPVFSKCHIYVSEPNCQGSMGICYLSQRQEDPLVNEFIQASKKYFKMLMQNSWIR